MKALIQVMVVSLGLVSGAVLAAETATQGEPIKLVVLDWQKLAASAPQAKEAAKRLEKEFQEPGEKLMNKQREYQTKRDKLQRDKDILSSSDKAKKEKELVRLEQDLRRMDEEYRSETTSRHREEMDEFLKIVKNVVDKIAQEEKYDAVFSQEVMVYYSERVDITSKVLQQLEKMAKSGDKGK